MYCIMFSRPISDEVRDTLFANAYLMLRSMSKKKRVKTSYCEGFIKTNFKEIFLYGMTGIVFEARLETDTGDLKISYLVRHQDLEAVETAEYGAWLTSDELDDLPSSKIRPNPILAVAKQHLAN